MANIDPFLTDLGPVELTTKWVVKDGAAPAGYHTTSQLLTLLDTFYVTSTYGDATWAAVSHAHIIDNVTGLQAALDGKAASAHAHTIGDITGLQASLDGKQPIGSYSIAGHTHTAAAVTDFSEAVDDRVAALLVAGTNITLTYDDAVGALTITAAGGGGGGGSGDVVGPSSATDNAIARYAATTGKLIQDSLASVTDVGEFDLPYVVNPGTPAADHGRLFMGKSATRIMPRFMGPNGQDTTLQPHIGKNKTAKWNAVGNGTVIVADGGAALTAVGTATARNVSTVNRATRLRMIEWLVTVAAATAVASFRAGAAQWTIGDTTEADMGGFHYVCGWGTATGGATPTHRAFVGMANSTAAPTDVEPSSITNIVGMGWGAADANVQIMHRGAGAVTKLDLGASFPVPSADRANAYLLELYSPPGLTQKVGYKVTNLTTSAVASGEITTNLPAAATFLGPRGWMSVGGTSSVIGIALSQLYLETDY